MDVRTLQHRVDEAPLSRDTATLNELVADDCRIIGPKGFIITKEDVARITRGVTSLAVGA